MTTSATAALPYRSIAQENPIQNFVDEKIKRLFDQYGWTDQGLLNEGLLATPGYTDFLQFIYKSKLTFSIRGYETSLRNSDSPLKEGIKMIGGQPHLYKEGRWTPWNQIMEEIRYDREKRCLVFANPENPDLDQRWNYLYPNGLVPQTRYNWIEHIHQLNPNEMDRLYNQGRKFFSEPQQAPPKMDCAFIQVFTRGNTRLEQIDHVGLRIIDQNGKVYSFGFETPDDEAAFSLKKIFSSLGTYNVTIASLDFTEFKPFGVRHTTTIPITIEQFERTLDKIKAYAETPLRFNSMHQNCATFTADILRSAGISIDTKLPTFIEGFYELCPPIETVPLIGQFLRRLVDIVKPIFCAIGKYTPKWCKTVVSILTYIPSKIFTVMKNLLLLALGAGKEATPSKTDEQNTDNREHLTSFKRVFSHWTDLFKDDAITMHIPYKISDWQALQGSTATDLNEGPNLYIIPFEATEGGA